MSYNQENSRNSRSENRDTRKTQIEASQSLYENYKLEKEKEPSPTSKQIIDTIQSTYPEFITIEEEKKTRKGEKSNTKGIRKGSKKSSRKGAKSNNKATRRGTGRNREERKGNHRDQPRSSNKQPNGQYRRLSKHFRRQ